MQTTFTTFTPVYNRKTRVYDVLTAEVEHPVLNGKAINTDDTRRMIGMIVAGLFLAGEKPAIKEAVLNKALRVVGSTSTARVSPTTGTISVYS